MVSTSMFVIHRSSGKTSSHETFVSLANMRVKEKVKETHHFYIAVTLFNSLIGISTVSFDKVVLSDDRK